MVIGLMLGGSSMNEVVFSAHVTSVTLPQVEDSFVVFLIHYLNVRNSVIVIIKLSKIIKVCVKKTCTHSFLTDVTFRNTFRSNSTSLYTCSLSVIDWPNRPRNAYSFSMSVISWNNRSRSAYRTSTHSRIGGYCSSNSFNLCRRNMIG